MGEWGGGAVKVVRATETKAHLSSLMARAGFGGERFPIERRGRPLAALVGVEDLERLERGRGDAPRSDRRGALALVGAWGDLTEDAEIDAMLGDIYATRGRDTGSPMDLEA